MGDGFIFAWEGFEIRLPLVQCKKGSYATVKQLLSHHFFFSLGMRTSDFEVDYFIWLKSQWEIWGYKYVVDF